MDRDTERKIARDLDLCDLVSAIGAPRARAKAEKQKSMIFRTIRAQNEADSLSDLTADQILRELES